jgi:hypothetical protein
MSGLFIVPPWQNPNLPLLRPNGLDGKPQNPCGNGLLGTPSGLRPNGVKADPDYDIGVAFTGYYFNTVLIGRKAYLSTYTPRAAICACEAHLHGARE